MSLQALIEKIRTDDFDGTLSAAKALEALCQAAEVMRRALDYYQNSGNYSAKDLLAYKDMKARDAIITVEEICKGVEG
ncbi:MAG TPA: hypothetical protein VIG33_14690 [Pseudobdellovibrionaceae bacterium]|jgi:hypothetical protein